MVMVGKRAIEFAAGRVGSIIDVGDNGVDGEVEGDAIAVAEMVGESVDVAK